MNCGYLCLFSNVRAGLRAGFGFGPRRVNLVRFRYIRPIEVVSVFFRGPMW